MGLLLAMPALAATPTDRGECAASADKPDVGFAACSRIIDDANVSVAERVKARKNRGRGSFQAKDYARAIADYDQSISINPRNGVAYWNRGNACAALRKIDDAIADYDRAIAINPKDFNAFNSRGKAWVAKGDSNQAIADFTQAIQSGPSYVEAYNNRGLSNEVLGRRAEAIADFRKAQSIDPADRVSKQRLRVLGF
jgi:tetratricopeptide (TPR) repeat protein